MINYRYSQQCPYDAERLFTQVFDALWDVSMPRKWTYSTFDYETRGIMVTGDYTLDAESMDAWTNTQRTIAQLAELYDEGKEFIIRDLKQVKMIFDIIMDYTGYVGWCCNQNMTLTEYAVTNDPNVMSVLHDVIKLQNFGNKIFPVVIDHVKMEPTTTGLLGFLNKQANFFGRIRRQLEFNPFERYGISEEAYRKMYDSRTKVAEVLDITKTFNPSTLDRIGVHL